MAITKPQDIIGTKVQIPVFHRGSLAHDSSHVVKQATALKQPFLYIRRALLPYLVLCSQVNQGAAGDWFFYDELTLYAEPETLNPTAYPLPNEEVAAHLHGQCGEEAEKTWEEEGESILANAKSQAQFAPLKAVLDGFEAIMRYKNAQYGNTGLEPVGVFSKGDTLEKLLSRADDKVARIKNSPMLRKNDCVDLMGYLVLICAHQGWHDFTDQQD